MLWVMNALLFLYFYPRFSKMDIYKCPILKKGLWELKFSYIITLWASAIPLCEGYLYDLIIYLDGGHVATIMVWIYNLLKIVNIFKTCPKKTLSCLWKTTFPNLGHLLETSGCKLLRSISPDSLDVYSPSHRTILENRKNIGDKIIVANIYKNLSSIFLNNSLPYTKLPVGL